MGSISFSFFWFPLSPKLHRNNMKCRGGCCTSQLRIPELRNPQTFIMTSKQFSQHLTLNETLSLLLWMANKAALCSRGRDYLCLTRLFAIKAYSKTKPEQAFKRCQCLSEVKKCKRIAFQQEHFYRKYLSITRLKNSPLSGEF